MSTGSARFGLGKSSTTPTTNEDRPDSGVKTGAARWGFLALGSLLTGIAVVGAFLPVLPTTPFLLLATPCFLRSSPRLHRRLLANKLLGPYLVQWARDRTVPRAAKRKAYGLVTVAFAISIATIDTTWLRVSLATLGLALLLLIYKLPTTRLAAAPTQGGKH